MYACEIIQLFSLVFCTVRAEHKFYFRLVTTPLTKKKLRHAVTLNLTGSICPPSPVAVASGKGLYPRCVGQLHFPVQKTCVTYSAAHTHCGRRQQFPPKHFFLFRPTTKTTSRLCMTQSIKAALTF